MDRKNGAEQLTYPDVACEPDGKDGSKDDDRLGPPLVAGLIRPIGKGLHQEDAAGCQLWPAIGTVVAYNMKVSTGMTANMHEREKYCLSAKLLDTQVKAGGKEGRYSRR